jgi:hypothetical protein
MCQLVRRYGEVIESQVGRIKIRIKSPKALARAFLAVERRGGAR